jgi:hypothetical protein
MTINELKVQVESQQDIGYLRTEATRFLAEQNVVKDLASEECEKVFVVWLNNSFSIRFLKLSVKMSR